MRVNLTAELSFAQPMTTMPSKLDFPAPLGGNRGVLTVANSLRIANEPFVLAIVVSTRGSTYRKPGAMAVVAQDGTLQGVISGGCLETTLQKAALEVLAANRPRILIFDTQSRDDVIFGSGSACRGLMQVLLTSVIPNCTNELFDLIHDAHQQHAVLKLVLSVDEGSIGNGCVWLGEGARFIGEPNAAWMQLSEAAAGEHVLHIDNTELKAAVLAIKPAPRLLIIGAGPEATPLMRIARSLGWFVTLIDHRAAAVNACSAYADRCFIARPHQALAELREQLFDAALVMTHTATSDLEALQALSTRNEPYIGLLGPPARRDELLAQLNSEARLALNKRLHAPLGLRLGGDGPEPLALSIAAELQRFLTQA